MDPQIKNETKKEAQGFCSKIVGNFRNLIKERKEEQKPVGSPKYNNKHGENKEHDNTPEKIIEREKAMKERERINRQKREEEILKGK